MKDLRLGDEVLGESGNYESGLRFWPSSQICQSGVSAPSTFPFTMSGMILVNDVKSSNYFVFQNINSLVVGEWKIALSYQWLAHMSQWPYRIWVRVVGVGNEIRNNAGMSIWVDCPHKFGE